MGSNLTPGQYLLEVYQHASNGGNIYNQEGAVNDNWEAEIIVVPEPSTIAAGIMAIVGTVMFRRRRAKA